MSLATLYTLPPIREISLAADNDVQWCFTEVTSGDNDSAAPPHKTNQRTIFCDRSRIYVVSHEKMYLLISLLR